LRGALSVAQIVMFVDQSMDLYGLLEEKCQLARITQVATVCCISVSHMYIGLSAHN
jgi:hypothetical protein